MAASRLEYLFNSYVDEKCSPEEEKELMELIAKSENEPLVQKLLGELIENTGSEIRMDEGASDVMLRSILQKDNAKVVPLIHKKANHNLWFRVAAAAVVLLFISGASYWILNKENKDQSTSTLVSSQKPSEILPGGNHAVLKMADGTTIVLDSLQNGKIQNGNATINKQKGLLVYDALKREKPGTPISYNTLTTPRGGQYQLVLPDGSKVWLNASSSLHFPTAFTGNQREVELTGEAYFEITKNKEKPFHVNVNGMQVEVLGTHFNVNAYADEDAIKTTLLEGSVKIKKGTASGLLKPGQQGVLEANGNNLKIRKADLGEVMAWKNGLFQFSGEGIKAIMQEIGRWYDVEVIYSGKVPARRFEGKISRDAQLSDVLKILELSNVKFKLNGRKIIVE